TIAARALLFHTRVQIGDPELDVEGSWTTVRAAIETLTELDDPRGLAQAYLMANLLSLREGRIAEATGLSECALRCAGSAADRHRRRVAALAVAHSLVRGPVPAAEAIRRCEELIRSAAHPTTEAFVVPFLSALVAMTGRLDEAFALVERSGRVLDELDLML